MKLLTHDQISRCRLSGQPIIKPGQDRRHLRILIAQAVNEFDRERIAERHLLEVGKNSQSRLWRARPGAQQPIGELIRLQSRGVAVDDSASQPPKILDEYDPQRNRDRPKLSDGERLDILIRMHIAAQHLDIEPAIRMRDECPRDAEHARISGERAVREFWQLAVVSWGEITPNFANLLFDKMIVVDQPLRGWCDRAALVDGLDDPAICIPQGIRIAGQAACEPMATLQARSYWLRNRKTSRVLLEALDTEKLFANRLAIIPWKLRVSASEDTGDERLQANLSSSSALTRRARNLP